MGGACGLAVLVRCAALRHVAPILEIFEPVGKFNMGRTICGTSRAPHGAPCSSRECRSVLS